MIKIYHPCEVRKQKKMREDRVKEKKKRNSKHAPELSCKGKKGKCLHYVG